MSIGEKGEKSLREEEQLKLSSGLSSDPFSLCPAIISEVQPFGNSSYKIRKSPSSADM